MQSLEPEITRSTYISSWFWTKSLIRSMGAAAVLETAAETPPMRKSVRNALASLGFRATSDIFTKTKGQRFGKKKIDKSGRIDKKVADRKWVQLQCRKEHWSSYTRSNNFFFSFFFPRKHGVKHAHLFFQHSHPMPPSFRRQKGK